MSNLFSIESIIQETSRCVTCGLCLPHCPTYLKTGSEADSPRGRIQLTQGVVKQHIPLNERFIEHIEACLSCRACENACPNHVAYGKIVNSARTLIETKRPNPLHKNKIVWFALSQLIAKPNRLAAINSLLRFYQSSGLQFVIRKLKILKPFKIGKWESYLPGVTMSMLKQQEYPPEGIIRGKVGLFLGCVARLFDQETLQATIFVLNRLGYAVHIPLDQTCCGSIHLHAGYPEIAHKLAKKNITAFRKPDIDAIISTASGCGAVLAEYNSYKSSESVAFATKVTDISIFLTKTANINVNVPSMNTNVAVHDPCSLRNVVKSSDAPYHLLKKIPELQIESLPQNSICCGAAGTYFLTQPDMSRKLQFDKIDAIQRKLPTYLATSNFGCAIHLKQGLNAVKSRTEVLHPITIVARQLGYKAGYKDKKSYATD